MDNIMNKIVEKISAQDIIKANSQAEAKEAERIKLEAEQYRLQLQELKANSEEYKKYLEEMRNDAKEYKAQLEGMRQDTKEYRQKLEESDTKIHDVGVQVYRNVQAIVEKGQQKDKEEFKELANKLEAIQVAVETKNNALMPLTIITMILVIADIVINVLRVLGIL